MAINQEIVIEEIVFPVIYFRDLKRKHLISYDIQANEWKCDCWHGGNRMAVNIKRHGICAHCIGAKEVWEQYRRDNDL